MLWHYEYHAFPKSSIGPCHSRPVYDVALTDIVPAHMNMKALMAQIMDHASNICNLRGWWWWVVVVGGVIGWNK